MMKTVEEYIASHPPALRQRLRAVRATVRKAAPKAIEKISYGIPAYMQDGRLVYFAAHTAHIGVYPLTAFTRKALGDALKPYTSAKAKATAAFPHDARLPLGLIAKIVRTRARENRERAARK